MPNPDEIATSLQRLGDAAADAATSIAAGGEAAARENRIGQKSIGFWTSKEAHKALHHLAIDQERTVESLMNEALNRLLASRGLPEIAVGPSDRGGSESEPSARMTA